MRSLKARSVGVDNPFAFGNLTIRDCLVDDLSQVVTDDFRQTSRMNGYNIRAVNRKNIINCLQQVGLSAENGRPFRKELVVAIIGSL
jgi:hypothetical protein